MTIYDISVALSSATPAYPGDPGIQISDWLTLANGDVANVSLLHFGAHSGTHVDAPAHFLEGAARSENLPLDALIGPATVIEVPSDKRIIDEVFVKDSCKAGTSRVLFKTRNSNFWHQPESAFRDDYSYLSVQAATILTEVGIRLVGIDYLSIEQFGVDRHETHFVLLRNGVVILEGLDLTNVSAGDYELICLPLRISGGHGDGAPARAVLRTID